MKQDAQNINSYCRSGYTWLIITLLFIFMNAYSFLYV